MNLSKRRSIWLDLVTLERRDCPFANLTISSGTMGLFPQYELVDPHPNAYGTFGRHVVPLSSGNIVVTDPQDDAGGTNAGAVYLFNGTTGKLISELIGSHDQDLVGINGVISPPNGDAIVISSQWNSDTGRGLKVF